MNSLKKLISKNQGTAAAIVIMIGLIIWTYGCESKVSSLIYPGKMVSRDKLNLEVTNESRLLENKLTYLIEQAQLKNQELDRRDAIKEKLFEFAALTAEQGVVNPGGVVALLFSVFGIGAAIDNRIKDKVIKNRPLAEVQA